MTFMTVVAALLVAPPARADDAVAQFFKGKQISIVIGSSVGGGYDTYARLIARHLSAHVPGHPTIVPQNMPGAGSNRAAYYVYTVAPKDGTTIGAIFSGSVVEPLLGTKPVQHDPSKFIYLGSANNDVFACLVRSDAPVKSFKDALSTEITMAASQEGGSTHDFPTLSNHILGTHFRIVSGYSGTREMTFAIERGEVQGQCGMSWPSLLAQRPDWVASGKVRVIVQEAVRGHPDLDKLGVPMALDFAKSPEDRDVLKLVYTQEIFGRPYVLPPGVPAERVAALRKAFFDTLADPALRAEAAKMRVDIAPIAGDEIQALVAKMYATPRPIVQRARQALADN
jgi:tripartite-type tricarboxylate transporter receptor subunit TctC